MKKAEAKRRAWEILASVALDMSTNFAVYGETEHDDNAVHNALDEIGERILNRLATAKERRERNGAAGVRKVNRG